MALLPEQEWVLVASALVAHADQVFEEDEWHHVLRLLDGPLAPDDQDHWFALFLDLNGLRQHFANLRPPPPLFAEMILERSWRVALADGVAGEVEIETHNEIADRLGVDRIQVAAWRDRWTQAAQARSELVAGFAAILANLEQPAGPAQWARYRSALGRLPLAPGRLAVLSNLVTAPPSLDSIAGRIVALARDERDTVFLALIPLVIDEAATPAERKTFLAMAERIALNPAEAARMLAR